MPSHCVPRFRSLALVAFAVLHMSASARAAEPAPLPSIAELQVYPAQLELNGLRDSRRLLVSGKMADGRLIDLTPQAQLTSDFRPSSKDW